jgi:nucleoid-associated protein YgaU
MPAKTQSGLEAAQIENLSKPGEVVNCMFNPHEYTLTKQNQYSTENVKGLNVPKLKFEQGGAETLKLQLFFDTYATGEETDVRKYTEKLWNMMMITDDKKNQTNNKSEPPHVRFIWGSLQFEAVITNISQKFTLFNGKGVPLRTTVDVSFQQAKDEQNHHKQNPTSGGGPAMKMHTVQAGDRLDGIAAKVYGDPTHWRLIAQANNLRDLLKMKEGKQLIIPPLE